MSLHEKLGSATMTLGLISALGSIPLGLYYYNRNSDNKPSKIALEKMQYLKEELATPIEVLFPPSDETIEVLMKSMEYHRILEKEYAKLKNTPAYITYKHDNKKVIDIASFGFAFTALIPLGYMLKTYKRKQENKPTPT